MHAMRSEDSSGRFVASHTDLDKWDVIDTREGDRVVRAGYSSLTYASEVCRQLNEEDEEINGML